MTKGVNAAEEASGALTEEQVKMNTVQQKRRLFNRKAGE
jgi:hypothetical protein